MLKEIYMTQTDWNKYYNVTTQANQAQALNEMVPIEEPEPLVVPQTIERQPTLLEQKIAKLQERDAEKRARVRPEAQTELQYQLQDWINPVKDAWNTLVPSGLELTRREVEMDPTNVDYGREFTLNNATGQREFGGKLIDGEWKTDYVTPEMAHLQGLAGTHSNPVYTKDANNQLIQMDTDDLQ